MRLLLAALVVLAACAPTVSEAPTGSLRFTQVGERLNVESGLGPVVMFAAYVAGPGVVVSSNFCSLTAGTKGDGKPDVCLANAAGWTELEGEAGYGSSFTVGRVSGRVTAGGVSLQVQGQEDGLHQPFTP